MNYNPLIFGYLALLFSILQLSATGNAETPPPAPYASYYNATSGFVPAQRDFTKILLQLAGSLEHHSTPEPYIRHLIAEHARISAKYESVTGKTVSVRPDYLTDDFVERLLANWKKLTPGLKLDALSRQSGRNLRLAVMGTWNMPAAELVAQETALTENERKEFARFIAKSHFTRADIPAIDRFYKDGNGYDKLSIAAKTWMSKRIERGIMDPEKRSADIAIDKGGSLVVKLLNGHQNALMNYLMNDGAKAVGGDDLLATLKTGLRLTEDEIKLEGMNEYERDALQYSHAIKADYLSRIDFLDKNSANGPDAKNMRLVLTSMIENLAIITNSEFRVALLERELGTR